MCFHLTTAWGIYMYSPHKWHWMPCTITDKLWRPQHDCPTAQVKPARVNKIAWYEIARASEVITVGNATCQIHYTVICTGDSIRLVMWFRTWGWSWLAALIMSHAWGFNLRVYYICTYIHTAKSTAMYLSNDVTASVYCSQPPMAQRLTRHDFKAAPPKLSTHSLVKYLPLHFICHNNLTDN